MAASAAGNAESQGPLLPAQGGAGSLPCVPAAASDARAEFLALVECWAGLEAEEFAALDPEGLPPVVGAVRRT